MTEWLALFELGIVVDAMTILIIISTFISITGAIAFAFRKPFSLAAPLSGMGVMLILFFFALFGYMRFSIWVILYLTVVGALITLYGLLFSPERVEYRQGFFDKGFWVFLFFAAFTLLINTGREVTMTDDFRYWAHSVRVMTHIDDLVIRHPETTRFGVSKVPTISLLQYYFSSLVQTYREFTLFATLQMLIYSFLLPLFAMIRKGVTATLFALATVGYGLILRYFDRPSSFNLLVVDPVLALEAGFGFFCIINPDYSFRYKAIALCLISALLPIQKDTGIVYLIMLLSGVLVQMILIYGQNKESQEWRTYGALGCMMLVSSIVPYVAWKMLI